MSKVQHFLREAARAFMTEDAAALLRILDLGTNRVLLHDDLSRITNIENVCKQSYRQDMEERTMLVAYLEVVYLLGSGNAAEAYLWQGKLAASFLRILQNSTDWIMPVCHQIAVDTRKVAEEADLELAAQGLDADKIDDVGRILMNMFKACNNDQGDGGKRYGVLAIINQLFYIYFKKNSLQQCQPLINQVTQKGFPPIESFSPSQKVTYKFYVGRLALFRNNFKEADEHLAYAFDNCWDRSFKNKRLILLFLLPARLYRGRTPTYQFLEKYDLLQFADISTAVRMGDIKKFKDSLDEHQEYFIQKGIYLIMEKLKMITFRNLFRRICVLYGSTRIKTEAFVTVLANVCEEELDYDEVECILANLISEDYIKGYISHEKRFLVVAAKNAFPKLMA